MYKLVIDDAFRKSYSKLSKVEQGATDDKLRLLAQNPWHKSLRVKKIRSTILFECSVNMDIRIAFCFHEDMLIVLLDIGHHDALLRRVKRRN